MTDNPDYSPSRLAARAEIADILFLWCRIVDRKAWDQVQHVFHPDAFDDHGLYRGDVKGMVEWLSERHKTISRSMHLIGNMFIEFGDDDNALVESYSFALQRYSSEGAETRQAIAGGADVGNAEFDMFMSGRYADHFQRRDGRWRILNRHVIFDNSQMHPVPADGPKMNSDWMISTRDSSDPIWELRRKLGIG